MDLDYEKTKTVLEELQTGLRAKKAKHFKLKATNPQFEGMFLSLGKAKGEAVVRCRQHELQSY